MMKNVINVNKWHLWSFRWACIRKYAIFWGKSWCFGKFFEKIKIYNLFILRYFVIGF